MSKKEIIQFKKRVGQLMLKMAGFQLEHNLPTACAKHIIRESIQETFQITAKYSYGKTKVTCI